MPVWVDLKSKHAENNSNAHFARERSTLNNQQNSIIN